jgi:chemotaxis protein methyltransferase CheR
MDNVSDGIEAITDEEFNRFRNFIYEHAGISMAPQKRHLVAARLHKRLRHYGFRRYGDYYRFVASPEGQAERQTLVDQLTTNETYFFREPAHFDYLRDAVLPRYRGRSFRVWSAACSTGEEVYTLAMVLAETLGQGDWEVHGTDINHSVVETARVGLYPMERARDIPQAYLRKYCLKGVRGQAGQLLVDAKLKQRVRFSTLNLKLPLREKTVYQVIFLRNVLIYFDVPTKREVVTRVTDLLEPGGLLFVSHVESLHGVVDHLEMVRPSVFRKPHGGKRA